MRWSFAGPIQGMKCTQINEDSDPHSWDDNYLCVPQDSPLDFQWSMGGPISGIACIQWLEPSDTWAITGHTWQDNYLCAARSENVRSVLAK